MFKRIITLFLAVAMVVAMGSLAGCKAKKPTTAQGNTSGLDKTEEEYFLNMPEDLIGTNVKYATWIDHEATDTAIALAGFEMTTGMSYELVSVKQSDYIPKLTSLIAADQSPDVVKENGDFPKTLNVLQPLGKDSESGLDPTDPFWDQDITEYFHIGDCYYMVIGKNCSWHRGGAMVYYNKTMLAENGVKDPAAYIAEDNWNLDTLWTLMTQVKSTCNLSMAGTYICFDDFLAAYGGNQVVFDTTTDKFVNTLKTAESKEAINYMMKAKDQGLASIMNDHSDTLSKGTSAVQIAGSYGLKASPGWFYAMDIADLGFAVMPKKNAGDANYAFTTNIRAYGICKGARNPRGGAYFMRYFLNEDNYDLSQVFKNEEARELNKIVRENQVIPTMPVSLGVGRVVDPSYKATTLVDELIKGTAAQVNVNLDIVNNKLQAAVDESNKMIAEIIENQNK